MVYMLLLQTNPDQTADSCNNPINVTVMFVCTCAGIFQYALTKGSSSPLHPSQAEFLSNQLRDHSYKLIVPVHTTTSM